MNISCCPKSWLHFFKAVGDVHRQQILVLIKNHKRVKTSVMLAKIKLSQPTLSHHLSILKNAGLIIEEKKGREIYYSINHKTIASCCHSFLDKLGK